MFRNVRLSNVELSNVELSNASWVRLKSWSTLNWLRDLGRPWQGITDHKCQKQKCKSTKYVVFNEIILKMYGKTCKGISNIVFGFILLLSNVIDPKHSWTCWNLKFVNKSYNLLKWYIWNCTTKYCTSSQFNRLGHICFLAALLW